MLRVRTLFFKKKKIMIILEFGVLVFQGDNRMIIPLVFSIKTLILLIAFSFDLATVYG